MIEFTQAGLLNEFSLNKLANTEIPLPVFGEKYIELISEVMQETDNYRKSQEFKDRLRENFLSKCKSGSTTHFSIADKSGNLVGFTSSLGETAGIIVPETGMIMNNLLGEDDVAPPEYSFKYGDRLLTMCCPSIIHTNAQWYSLGSPGSSR